jgi:hypothetical protein
MTPSELPVVQAFYTFSVQMLRCVQSFPRNLRHGLGRSIELRVEDLLAKLIEAKYASAAGKEPMLRQVNVQLEVLRFQVRQAVELKGLPLSKQEGLLKELRGVGE